MSVLEKGSLLDPFAIYPGLREPFTGATPAAGADFTQKIEGKYTVRLTCLHVKLVASADAANREVVLEYRNDQGLRFALMGAPVTWPAGSTVYYEFNAHQQTAEWTVDGSVLVPLFPMWLPPAWDFRVHVVNMDDTDALSEIRGVWERFYTDGPT